MGLGIDTSKLFVARTGIRKSNDLVWVGRAANYAAKQVVGIDTSKLFVARTGIRKSNDLVWVGRAANYAAKLCLGSSRHPSRLTKAVYDKLSDSGKYVDDGKKTPMWKKATWNNLTIYRSTCIWPI